MSNKQSAATPESCALARHKVTFRRGGPCGLCWEIGAGNLNSDVSVSLEKWFCFWSLFWRGWGLGSTHCLGKPKPSEGGQNHAKDESFGASHVEWTKCAPKQSIHGDSHLASGLLGIYQILLHPVQKYFLVTDKSGTKQSCFRGMYGFWLYELKKEHFNHDHTIFYFPAIFLLHSMFHRVIIRSSFRAVKSSRVVCLVHSVCPLGMIEPSSVAALCTPVHRH